MSTLIISAGRVTTITLNRPDVRNAFNEELIAELTDWARGVRECGAGLWDGAAGCGRQDSGIAPLP